MSGTGTTRTWDLTDAAAHHRSTERGRDVGGPVAATLGGITLALAVLPGLGLDVRWTAVAVTESVAVLVAAASLRRRRSVLSFLLVVCGLVAAVGAGVPMAGATRTSAAPSVASVTVPDGSLGPPLEILAPTPRFAALPTSDRAEASRVATGLVLRMRTLHGEWGPFPAALAVSQGAIVEATGPLQGTPVGAATSGSRILYEVAASGTAFRVTVTSRAQPEAAVAADSALVVPSTR